MRTLQPPFSNQKPHIREFLNAEVSGDTGAFEVSTETDANATVDASGALPGHSLVYLPPQVRDFSGHICVQTGETMNSL